MTSLLTNAAAMTALTTLKKIGQNLDTTSNRVSTGQRVSSAADNAAYWSIATTVRTDNASLSAVKDSLGLGSSAVDTAYNGLTSVITNLQTLRSKLQTALQPGVDRSKVQTEIAAIQNQMKATADSSVSSGQNWLSVNSADATYQADRSIVSGFSRDSRGSIRFSMFNIPVSTLALYNATVRTPAAVARVTGTQALAATYDFSGTNEVNFSVHTMVDPWTLQGARVVLNRANLSSAAADITKVTRSELLNAINNQTTAWYGTYGQEPATRASFDSDNRLVFETIATSSYPAAGAQRTISVANETLSTITQARIDIGFGTNSGYGPDNIAGTADDDAVRPVFTARGADAGTTPAQGILDTVDGSTGVSVQSIDLKQLGTGTLANTQLMTLVTQVEKAIARATDAGTILGASKTQIDGQKTFVDTLIKVNERTIGTLVDADIEEELVKLKALQTQQQLAVQALSIANAASQNVLSLFR